MDRQKCQHGADKMFEIKEKRVSAEWERKIWESVHEKWQMGPMKGRQYVNDIRRGEERLRRRDWGWEDGVPSLPLTEWLIGVAVPMLSCWETGHWWMARLQGDVYFVVNLHICMYLQGGWLLLARISPHLNMMDLAVWQNGQLSDRDIQPTLCPHDGWAHANTQPD